MTFLSNHCKKNRAISVVFAPFVSEYFSVVNHVGRVLPKQLTQVSHPLRISI